MLKSALLSVAASLDELLRHDPFPDEIRPEYLSRAVRDYPVRGGKRLRPAIVLWCAGAVGGESAVPMALLPAAAIEVFHNWTLVHDDIIDRDEFRRNMPTEHMTLAAAGREAFQLETAEAERFGRDMAILAGDLQQAWAQSLLLRSEISAELRLALLAQLNLRGYRELVSGEAMDVEFAVRAPESIAAGELHTMLYGKTGALLRFAAEAGAVIGLGKPDFYAPAVRALGAFAEQAAIAFQLRDDYLGIFGDAKFGKPLGSDLAERKTTRLLQTALTRLDASGRAELNALLGLEHYEISQLERARALFRDCGAAAAVEAESARLLDAAKAELKAVPPGNYRDLLLELADYLAVRES